MTLSVCMIVKNEQDFINNCLNSIQAAAHEIIIIDTGCSDKTIEIARQFNVKVFPFQWVDDFSAARNEALKQATGKWILQIDADETLDSASLEEIKQIISRTDTDAFTVSVRNYHPEEDMVKYMDSKQIRLFRNNRKYSYINAIHEQIALSIEENGGRIQDSSILIHHYGYQNKNTHKAQRNRILLEKSVQNNPEDGYLQFKLGETYKALQQNEAAKNCFLKALSGDGQGLSSEILDAIYLRLAQLELAENRYQESVQFARKSLLLNPDNALSLYIISIGLLYTGRVKEADAFLKHLKKINSNKLVPDEDIEPLIQICENYKKGKNS